MSVLPNQPVSAAVTNAAYISKTTDSVAVSKVTLNKATEGAQVESIQKAVNKIYEGLGTTGQDDTAINDYANNNYIVDGDSRKIAVEKLDAQLKTTQTQLDTLDGLNSQDVSANPIGSTPNANGFTIGPNQALNLEPASASFGGVVTTGAQTIAGNKTFSGNTVFNGDVTVNGTTTTVNSATVDSVDPNITVNKTGNDASSEGAGLTIDRTGTNGSLVYANALSSRFKLGDLGSEKEVVDVSSAQTLTNKTITSPSGLVKADVGLSNVTNDSQLKRADGDFSTFTEKTLLVDNDVFIIEDSAAAGAKKFVKKVNLGFGSGSSALTVTTIKTANYTLAINELARGDASGGAFAFTLPTAIGVAGQALAVYRTDQTLANIITINTTSSQTIGSYGTSVTLATQTEYWLFISDGANWIVAAHTYSSVPFSFSPTATGLGSNGIESAFAFRDTHGLSGRIVFTSGTTAASTFSSSLPTGLTIDTSSLNTAAPNTNYFGTAHNLSAATAIPASTGGPFALFSDASVSNTVLYAAIASAASRFDKALGTIFSTGGRAVLNFKNVPITNWK